MSIGRVHSFESFGTVDGPGIRFVAFLQGCHLTCLYCHNRDLWSAEGGSLFSPEALLEEVETYRPYFESSGGGVTISGGEPLLQAPFLRDFLALCKKKKIHTAIDTSGALPLSESVKEALALTSMVLLDIKHPREEMHRKITGQSNEFTLAIARHLQELGTPFWVRYVVVPDYSDSLEDAQLLAEILKPFTMIEKIEVIPYHSLGEHKWREMAHAYPLEGTEPPPAERIAQIREILRR